MPDTTPGLRARAKRLKDALVNYRNVRAGRADARPGMRLTGDISEERELTAARTAVQRQLAERKRRGY